MRRRIRLVASLSSPRRAHIPGRWRAQRSRCESGAVPQLRCLRLEPAEDEPGRLLSADELSPRRKGGSRGAAAEPPPSASRGGFLWSEAGTPGLLALAALVLVGVRPPARSTRRSRRGSSRSRRPRPRICSRSAPASRSSRSTTSRTTRRTRRTTKLSGYTPNAEAIAAYKPDLVVVSFDGEPHRRGAREAEDPGARRADRVDASPRPTARSRQLGKATGHVAGRGRGRRADEDADRGDRRVDAAREPADHRLPRARARPLLGDLEDVHRPHLHAARAEGHRRRGRQDRLRLPAALAGVHRRGEPAT